MNGAETEAATQPVASGIDDGKKAALEGESIQQELLEHYSGDVKQAWDGMNEHVAFVGLASWVSP